MQCPVSNIHASNSKGSNDTQIGAPVRSPSFSDSSNEDANISFLASLAACNVNPQPILVLQQIQLGHRSLLQSGKKPHLHSHWGYLLLRYKWNHNILTRGILNSKQLLYQRKKITPKCDITIDDEMPNQDQKFKNLGAIITSNIRYATAIKNRSDKSGKGPPGPCVPY